MKPDMVRMIFMVAALTSIWSVPQSQAKDKIDSGLFAAFSAAQDGSSISMLVCGQLPDSSGCYGSGAMSPFERACAVLEGNPSYKHIENGQTVTRAIYVLDRRKSKSASAILYIYTRTDTITQDTYDSVSLSLTNQVTLSFTGGGGAKCSMAANDVAVYVGTDLGGASTVDKKSLSVGALSGPGLVSITADERGYVAVSSNGGDTIYAPNGGAIQGGGGYYDMINNSNAWKPN